MDKFILDPGTKLYNKNSHDASKQNDQQDKKITRNQKRKHDEKNVGSKKLMEADPTIEVIEIDQETKLMEADPTIEVIEIDQETKLMVADPTIEALDKEQETITKGKFIDKIQFGTLEIETWYSAPFPGEYGKQSKLWICEYCLKYMKLEETFQNHMGECLVHHPPGQKIYCKDTLSVYEVDGEDQKLYCQNLCLLAKLFLDEKTLFYDVEPFLFYVLTICDPDGTPHLIGYFSKGKGYPDGNNVACILILPTFQGTGLGNFLIAFSYELTKLDNKIGSPEKPLSALGKRSYVSYWLRVIIETIKDQAHNLLPLNDLCRKTGIAPEDIIYTLETHGMSHLLTNQRILVIPPRRIEEKLKIIHRRKPKYMFDAKFLEYGPLRKQQSLFRSSHGDMWNKSLPQKAGRS